MRHLAAINGSYELPFGRGRRFFSDAGAFGDRLISGFTLSPIANIQTGFPFSPQLGYNPTGSGDTRNPIRPNVNPSFQGSIYSSGSTASRVNQFFSPGAFLPPLTEQ